MAGETRKEKEKRAQKDDERRAAKRKEADLPGMIMQVGTCEQPNRLPRCGPSSHGQRRAFMQKPGKTARPCDRSAVVSAPTARGTGGSPQRRRGGWYGARLPCLPAVNVNRSTS